MECPECRNNDPNLFLYDQLADGSTCEQCGAVLPSMCFADLSTMQPVPSTELEGMDLDEDELAALDAVLNDLALDSSGGDSGGTSKQKTTRKPKPFAKRKPPKIVKQSSTTKPKQPFKGSYGREAYIHERLRASLCREPVIPEVDVEEIKDYYRKVYSKRDIFQKERAAKGYIKKADIQQILRSLDRKHKTKRFTQQYLEKWKSIKVHLGGKVKLFTPQETMAIGAQLKLFSAKWDLHQPPSHKLDRKVWKFKDRKDMPSFNTLMKRILEKLGIRGFYWDFPLPVTKNSQKKLAEYVEFLDPNENAPKLTQTKLTAFLKP